MKIDDLKFVKIPFTLYDLFGYLLPGLLFFALFPITYDFTKSVDILESLLNGNSNIDVSHFLIFKLRYIITLSPWLLTIYILLIAYLMGHIIAALSSFIYERVILEKYLKYPAANMFELKTYNGFLEKVFKKLLMRLPQWIKCWLFGNYRRKYSDEFMNRFKYKFNEEFKLEAKDQSDIFWLTFSYTSQNCPATFQRASHFLNLYGFARNLSMTFLFFAVSIFLLEITQNINLSYYVLSIYLALSFIFFWQYLKFFRRLNDEVYRGFVAHQVSQK